MRRVLNSLRLGNPAKRHSRRKIHSPLITIAVPAYNRPALLAETLASIAAQTAHVPLEVIVCDDGGLKETRDAVERYSNVGFRYHLNKVPLGAVGNWNQCLKLARGKWVMVLHEDDTLYPWYLESVLPHLSTGPVAVCTMTSRGAVPPVEKRPRVEPAIRHYPPRYFLKSSMTPFPGVLVRRDIAIGLRGFDEAWGPIADYEFWYRLSCAGRIDVVRAVGAFYRVGPGQWTERIWSRMIGLTHLLRLKIAREQFPESRKTGRWLARFFTFRNAGCYAERFEARPEALRRCLSLGCMPLGRLPTGWVWGALKFASHGGSRHPVTTTDARRAPQVQQGGRGLGCLAQTNTV
jgi:glycosyltransferase involved in cell wall biosynthesis